MVLLKVCQFFFINLNKNCGKFSCLFISGDYLVCSFLDFWIIIEYLEHFLIANGFTINIVPLMPLFNCLFISFPSFQDFFLGYL